VEASLGEVRLEETERGRGQRGSGKEMRRVGEKETKGEKVGRDKESSREMGNLGQREGDGKVRSGG